MSNAFEKAKITKGPSDETVEAARKWQKKRFGESSIEKDELPLGDYKVRADFKLTNGEESNLPFSNPVTLKKDETIEDLKKKALSWASTIGLHNFGMDVYRGRYPEGHPVDFTMTHKSGKEVKFTQIFDGSGYPIYKK